MVGMCLNKSLIQREEMVKLIGNVIKGKAAGMDGITT